jgi:membrane protein DedA with SNARE-associated domain
VDDPGILAQILTFIEAQHDGLGPLLLFAASLIEYVFPPFPGDAITLFGTYLVLKGLWSFWFALGLTTLGSLAGASLGFWFGRWLGKRLDRLPAEAEVRRWSPLTREKYELLAGRFRKHGAVYIAINRFLPGIRAFFFVAAGAAGMPFLKVLLYAALSALAWNAALLGVGYALGASFERLQSLFASYTTVVWALLGAALVAASIWLLVRWRRRRARGEEPR